MTGIEAPMAREIREAPEALRRQEQSLAQPVAELASRLKCRPPLVAVTCARGSSAHAATFGKHLIERYTGIPVAAAAPVIASVYRQELRLKDQLFLAISQSGRSDDLIETTAAAKRAGALTAAILNDTGSPLAAHCDLVLPMCAGPELSVAATKTFVATLAALLRLAAAWTGNTQLEAAIGRLPDRLAAASDLDWSGAVSALARRAKPRHHWARANARDCARSGAQAQGNLQSARGGVQRRGIPAWARGAGVLALSDPDVHAHRCGGGRHAAPGGGSAREGRGAVYERTGSRQLGCCQRSRRISRKLMLSA